MSSTYVSLNKTLKQGYASVNPTPNGPAVPEKLVEWFANYNSAHPHSTMGNRSPDEFREHTD